ncbi:hypothetical protein HPB47_001680 [Ixodes persulcatus]|uniref:Uncharacterized protein n=1 Tax=Ixodes persulcatus TaxID=34615 RepID=A0AC60PNB4_IXOPE|nr:hypothetical protein HPB47_001680 [Ixodes persulcatus]
MTDPAQGADDDPTLWKPDQVLRWFQWACRHFGLQDANASDWNLTGKQLCELSHAEFVRRIAFDPGDLFWTHLELLRKCKIVAVIQQPVYVQQTPQMITIQKTVNPSPRNRIRVPKLSPRVAYEGSPGNRTGNNGQIQLWQFLLEMLTERDSREYIQWIGDEGEFKLNNPEMVAQLWGLRKNKPTMNYEKLSRALRYYYDGDMIAKVHGKRFVYKFVCDLKQLVGYSASELNRLVLECEQRRMEKLGGSIMSMTTLEPLSTPARRPPARHARKQRGPNYAGTDSPDTYIVLLKFTRHASSRHRRSATGSECGGANLGQERQEVVCIRAPYLVNCSFYFKIGACRHGDRCSRIHNKPTFSQTVLLQNLYHNPQNSAQTADGSHLANMTEEEMQEHFDNFFEDVFVELEDKFRREEDAEKAVADLNNRWFAGHPIYSELSPVTDFREACCRQYEMGECTRSGFCNFMHLKPISRELRRELYGRKRRKSCGVGKLGRGGGFDISLP